MKEMFIFYEIVIYLISAESDTFRHAERREPEFSVLSSAGKEDPARNRYNIFPTNEAKYTFPHDRKK